MTVTVKIMAMGSLEADSISRVAAVLGWTFLSRKIAKIAAASVEEIIAPIKKEA